jgi:hypothetical protein
MSCSPCACATPCCHLTDTRPLPAFRYCWTNITRNWPICVSDEHGLPTLLASYGLDRQTDCQGRATWTDWSVAGWHPQQFLEQNMSALLVERMRAAPRSESPLARLLGLLRGQGFVQYSTCNTGAALRSARVLVGSNAAPGAGDEASGILLAAGKLQGAISRAGADVLLKAHVGFSATSQTTVRSGGGGSGHGTAHTAQGAIRSLLASVGISGQGAHAASARAIKLPQRSGGSEGSGTSRQEPYAARLAAWAREELGYQALGSHCSLQARKFPSAAVPAALQMALSCGGLGIGSWCEQNQPLPGGGDAAQG